jgi:hypothetical protein
MTPRIDKLGTIDCDLVETNPVVVGGHLYRFEYVRPGYRHNDTGDSYFRFVDWETGQVTPAFAAGHHLGCAFVDGDRVVVTCVDIWDGEHLLLYESRDLQTWERRDILHLPGYGLFNTSLCRGPEGYVLMFEVGKPPEIAGKRFTARFATSPDLQTWKLRSAECTYAKDRYTAPHCLRWHDGWFYDFYLEAHEGPRYDQRVVRSRDLVAWEPSPRNPVLPADEADKAIANPALDDDERRRIADADNRNNSDIDFCEFDGRTVLTYSWGNQQGVEFLATATFDGSETEFLRAWFD